MTYNVFGGTLSLTQSINQAATLWCCQHCVDTDNNAATVTLKILHQVVS